MTLINVVQKLSYCKSIDEISAIVKTIDVNRYAVWMNDQYKFSVAAGVNDYEEVEWYVIEKNKYVPYVDQIGNKIENYLS